MDTAATGVVAEEVVATSTAPGVMTTVLVAAAVVGDIAGIGTTTTTIVVVAVVGAIVTTVGAALAAVAVALDIAGAAAGECFGEWKWYPCFVSFRRSLCHSMVSNPPLIESYLNDYNVTNLDLQPKPWI